MFVAQSAPKGSFAELVKVVTNAGLQRCLPALAECGARSLADVASCADALIAAGVPPSDVVTLVGLRASAAETAQPLVVAPVRSDVPVRRREASASLQAALAAAEPQNRKRSLELVDQGLLAASSRGPVESRLRTWRRLAEAWGMEPFPITVELVRVMAASFKAGAYRSAQGYFDAARWHQEAYLGSSLDPLVARSIRRHVRSVLRGLPATTLKEAFPFLQLATVVQVHFVAAPFVFGAVPHMVDVLILACWFMLREVEIAAARLGDLQLGDREVALSVPIHKVAQGGERELTRRCLRCVCGAATHPLCPVHAAVRHIARLHMAAVVEFDAPLVPGAAGGEFTKGAFVEAALQVLRAAGIDCMYVDPNGRRRPRFRGHLARVAGATFLASKGVPIEVIQLLGRWSSSAILRYTQAAPLAAAPEVPATALAASTQQSPERLHLCSQVAGAPPIADAPPDALAAGSAGPDGPPGAWEPPEVVHVLAPALALPPPEAPEASTVCIMAARTRRLHRTDAAESTRDSLLWQAPCGFPYGVRSHYRLSAEPPAPVKCLRCFKPRPQAQPDLEPTEEIESPSALSESSDAASSCSSSS